MITESQKSQAIQSQLQNPNLDIFTGLPFRDKGNMTDEMKEQKFREHIAGLDNTEKAKAYIAIKSTPSQEQLDQAVAIALENATRDSMEQTVLQTILQQVTGDPTQIEDYVRNMDENELQKAYSELVIAQEFAKTAAMAQQQYGATPPEELIRNLNDELEGYTTAQCASYYETVLTFSESTYDQNLKELGYVQLDYPATMNLYASSFENKEVIEDYIAAYNADVEELKQIQYTDMVGLMLSGVTDIINAITYVLIAFVAISLVVSSIMIGVITLISVQERTKEIGILRAIGASKRNVSSMFNAETVMIGFASGVLGVGVTYLLCIPINAIVQALTNINNLRAYLPLNAALVLIAISVGLTLLSGLIPSRSAAKKDPVVALRTE